MTRRLSILILLAVWSAIVLAGLAAWFTTRAVLLADLDASIVRRALALPEVAGRGGPPALDAGDEYVVYDDDRRPTRRPDHAAAGRAAPHPVVTAAQFVRLPAGHFRVLTLRIGDGSPGEPPAATVIYRGSAQRLDDVLRKLALALGGFGALAGAAAALAAARLARLALRPLRATARHIGAIDEAHLARRIDAEALPAELRPMAAQLNAMLERLERAFAQRRQFMADASHELRTPVAAIVTTLEVALRRPRSPAELTETLEICLAEARHMQTLVQGLMRQVRAEHTTTAEQSVQTLDAAQLVGQCVELTASLAAERNIRLAGPFNGAVPARVVEERLRSVVLNLLSNAIEYNRPGGMVEVDARTSGGYAEITVHDDGPGIPPNELPNLFQPFVRGAVGERADGHLGLGLFLVDSHVRAMGGHCQVESQPGSGTTFRVRLPVPGGPSANKAD